MRLLATRSTSGCRRRYRFGPRVALMVVAHFRGSARLMGKSHFGILCDLETKENVVR
jgi:hypothetical protein